jgi:hypothetical protein
MKMKKMATTEKTSTPNSERKELHEIRRYKLVYLEQLREQEREQEIKDYIYNAKKPFQK